jgi:methionine-gamma-lyase
MEMVNGIVGQKRMRAEDEGKVNCEVLRKWMDPVQGLANIRREFGEHGGVNMSIEASTTFTVLEPETMGKLFMGTLGPEADFYVYSRHYNPTVLNLSRQMAAMEGTQAAYCTASGMSAIAAVLMQLCSSGDHIVASNRLYGGSHCYLARFLPRSSNITTTFVDITDHHAVKAAIKPSTKVLYFESVSNPQLCVANIPVLADIAHEQGVTVVVDNTFAPIILSPARHGADVVVHSMTKFISGSSDIIAGAVCGTRDLIASMMGLLNGALMLMGPTMNPQVAFQLSMRLPHLDLRMKEHCDRAMLFSKRMKKLGLEVIYPGLEDHPQHDLMKKLLNEGYGFGGMLCVDLKTEERANDLLRHLQNVSIFGLIAVSLGYHDTLMSNSGNSTSSELSKEEQNTAGISAGLVRLSIGFTDKVEKRWSQLLDGLKALKLVPENAS